MKPHPLFVSRAAGAHVWDLSGSEYVDYVMAWGPMIAGHSHPHIIEAVMDMVPRMQMLGMGHELEYETAELVLEAVPGTERLLWTNSGTEAVQIALRLARAATGRNRVLKFTKSYHGWHDSVYASLGAEHTGETAIAGSAGQSPNAIADLIVTEFNDIAAVERILSEARARDIAAVLVDPIMSNAGVVAPAPGFLERLRELCDTHGVVLIFDQVIAGFRIARGGATERYGVTPDLSVFGKAIAGGFSQSAVAGKAELIDQVAHGVTHAVSASFESGLQNVFDQLPFRPTFRRIGSLLYFVPASIDTAGGPPADLWDTVTADMLRHGIALLPSGKIFLSTAHTQSDVDRTVAALEKTVQNLGALVGP
jgi:glutamate-1-semialdehyde 2,1-aminomutase